MSVAVLAFCAAKGAPGVTTTALLAAALWPRPVMLADCDPDGGDVALRLPDAHGAPLDPGRGLLTLLPHARRRLEPSALHEHTQQVVGGIPVLAGLAGPEQAEAAGTLWDTLAGAFVDLPGTDVVVDAGRVHGQRVHLPVLRRADVVVWVVRPRVSDVVHLRERLHALEPVLVQEDGTRPRTGVAVVAPVDARTEVDDVLRSLRPELPWVELFGHVALDRRGSRIFNGAGVRRPDRTMLVRSGHPLVAKLIGALPRRPHPLSATLQQVPLMVQHAEPDPAPRTARAEPAPRRAASPRAAHTGPVPTGAAPGGPGRADQTAGGPRTRTDAVALPVTGTFPAPDPLPGTPDDRGGSRPTAPPRSPGTGGTRLDSPPAGLWSPAPPTAPDPSGAPPGPRDLPPLPGDPGDPPASGPPHDDRPARPRPPAHREEPPNVSWWLPPTEPSPTSRDTGSAAEPRTPSPADPHAPGTDHDGPDRRAVTG